MAQKVPGASRVDKVHLSSPRSMIVARPLALPTRAPQTMMSQCVAPHGLVFDDAPYWLIAWLRGWRTCTERAYNSGDVVQVLRNFEPMSGKLLMVSSVQSK